MIDLHHLDVRHLTIGEMARLNKISEQTLRLYDREGIFSPLGRDEGNGYRYYDIRQSAQLDIIRYLRALGMPLRDIRQSMEDWSTPRLRELLCASRAAIETRLRELELQKRAIDRMLENCERYLGAPPDSAIVLEYIPRRQMYVKQTTINFYDYEIDVYEQILRELKEDMMTHQISPLYFSNAGTILKREDLLARRFRSTQVFVFVDREYVDEELITTIPAGYYLCIYCDRFSKERSYIERLLEYIQEVGYTVTGDYLCEVVMELPQDYTERGMFLRLQVPVDISGRDKISRR